MLLTLSIPLLFVSLDIEQLSVWYACIIHQNQFNVRGVRLVWPGKEWRLIKCDSLLAFCELQIGRQRLCIPPVLRKTFSRIFVCHLKAHSPSDNRKHFCNFLLENFPFFRAEQECLNKFSFLRSRFCVRSDSSGDKWNLFSNLITRTMQWCWLCTTAQASPAHNTEFEWEQAPAEILMLIFFQRGKRQEKNNRIFISVVANLTWNNLLLSKVLFSVLKSFEHEKQIVSSFSHFFQNKLPGLVAKFSHCKILVQGISSLYKWCNKLCFVCSSTLTGRKLQWHFSIEDKFIFPYSLTPKLVDSLPKLIANLFTWNYHVWKHLKAVFP